MFRVSGVIARPRSTEARSLEEDAGVLLPEVDDCSQPDQPDDAREDPGYGRLRPADSHIWRADEQRQGVQAEQDRSCGPCPVLAAAARPGQENPQPDTDQAQ